MRLLWYVSLTLSRLGKECNVWHVLSFPPLLHMCIVDWIRGGWWQLSQLNGSQRRLRVWCSDSTDVSQDAQYRTTETSVRLSHQLLRSTQSLQFQCRNSACLKSTAIPPYGFRLDHTKVCWHRLLRFVSVSTSNWGWRTLMPRSSQNKPLACFRNRSSLHLTTWLPYEHESANHNRVCNS